MEIMSMYKIFSNFMNSKPFLSAVVTMILMSGFAWLVVEVVLGWR